MAIYNVHAGHSLVCRGASGLLDEVNEDRKVKDKVIQLLKEAGHTVYDCTDDSGKTQSQNLKNIVAKCNAHSVALDVSIHLNAGGGTGSEVWIYNSKNTEIASRISSKISSSLGISNRGVKVSKSLYVLKRTKAPAVLVECCFVDSEKDRNAWNTDVCAKAIVEGILNTTVNVINNPKPSSPTSSSFKVRIDINDLNIRKGPGTNYAKTGTHTGKGIFTITEVKNGPGSKIGWGKLKSNVGWISLDFTKRV